MSPNPTSLRPLLLVALATFALGMMTDRVFFFSGGAGVGPDTTPSDNRTNRGASRSQSAGPRGNNERDRSPRDRGERPDDEPDPDHEEDGLPSPVQRVLEGLERGGRIDAAMAAGLLDQVNSVRHRREVIERLARH
ncbi:MAG: hypothetical protein K9N23_16920 [Akkermansiaceae bacterium]|nr:hypothetical protein [Akkermansiaceae bacterium]MCF7733375.1 hypothetical protein [Akkermansiaceae bacterium]